MSETKVSSMLETFIIPFVIALETWFQGPHAWLMSSMSETGINLSHYRNTKPYQTKPHQTKTYHATQICWVLIAYIFREREGLLAGIHLSSFTLFLTLVNPGIQITSVLLSKWRTMSPIIPVVCNKPSC